MILINIKNGLVLPFHGVEQAFFIQGSLMPI